MDNQSNKYITVCQIYNNMIQQGKLHSGYIVVLDLEGDMLYYGQNMRDAVDVILNSNTDVLMKMVE